MRSNAGMANRQGDVDLHFAQVLTQLTLCLGLGWLGSNITARTHVRRLQAFQSKCIRLDTLTPGTYVTGTYTWIWAFHFLPTTSVPWLGALTQNFLMWRTT